LLNDSKDWVDFIVGLSKIFLLFDLFKIFDDSTELSLSFSSVVFFEVVVFL
jgi:hypothetical protein